MFPFPDNSDSKSSETFERLQREVSELARSFSPLSAAMQQNARATQGLASAQRQLANTQKTLASAAQNTVAPMSQMSRAANQAQQGIGTLQRSAKASAAGFKGFRGELQSTALVFGLAANAAAGFLKSQVSAAASIERLKVGLEVIAGSASAAEAQYRRLVDVSRLPGINIENSLRATLQLQALGQSGEKAAETIREFGNVLALSGTAPTELNRVIEGIRQITGEGKIIQEDIAILTTRLAAAVPIFKELFGGTRAADIRKFFDSMQVEESEQAAAFLEMLLPRLQALPRAGETAANAMENLSDTFQRTQAEIGENYLPIVVEATQAIEGFLFKVEQNEGVAKMTASIAAAGAAFVATTAAVAGIGAALTLLASGPVGIAALAIGGIAAAIVGWKVASQETASELDKLNERVIEHGTILKQAEADYRSLAVVQRKAGIESLEQLKTDLQSRQELIRADIEQTRALIKSSSLLVSNQKVVDPFAAAEADLAKLEREQTQVNLTSPMRSGYSVLGIDEARSNAERLEGLKRKLAELIQQLEEVDARATQVTTRLASLPKAAIVEAEALGRQLGSLRAQLQEITTLQNIPDFRSVKSDGNFDFDDIEATAKVLSDIEKQAARSAASLEALRAAAGDNADARASLEALTKALDELREAAAQAHLANLELGASQPLETAELEKLIAFTTAFIAGLDGQSAALQQPVSGTLTSIVDEAKRLKSELSSEALRIEIKDENAQRQTEAILKFEDVHQAAQAAVTLDAQRAARRQLEAYIESYQGAADGIQRFVDRAREQLALLAAEIKQRETSAARDTLTLEIHAEDAQATNSLRDKIEALNEAARAGDIDELERALKRALRLLREVQSGETSTGLLDAEGIETDLADLIQRLEKKIQDAEFDQLEIKVKLREEQFLADAADAADTLERKMAAGVADNFREIYQALRRPLQKAFGEFERLETRYQDARSARQLQTLIRENQQFIAHYSKRVADINKALDTIDPVETDALGLPELRDQLNSLVDSAHRFHDELETALDFSLQQERLENFKAGVQNVVEELARISLSHLFDSFRVLNLGNVDTVTNDLERRLERFDADGSTRVERLKADRDRQIQRLRDQQRQIAARRPVGNQKGIEQNIQRQQDISVRITEVNADFARRIERFREDQATRRGRMVEDAAARGASGQDRGLVSQLGSALETAVKKALAAKLAGYLTKTAFDAGIGLVTGGLGLLKDFFGGGDKGGPVVQPRPPGQQRPSSGQTTNLQQGLQPSPLVSPDSSVSADRSEADRAEGAGARNQAGKVDVPLANIGLPTEPIELQGSLKEVVLHEFVKKPIVPGLKGGLIEVVLQRNVALPTVKGLSGEIGELTVPAVDEIVISPDVDPPSVPGLHGLIETVGVTAEDVPTVDVAGIIGPLSVDAQAFDGLRFEGLTLTVDEIGVSPDIDLPSVPGLHGLIETVGLTVAPLPEVEVVGRLTSLVLTDALPVDLSPLAGERSMEGLHGTVKGLSVAATPPDVEMTGRIDELVLSPDIDTPTVEGLHGLIETVGLGVEVPEIDATAVINRVKMNVGSVEVPGRIHSGSPQDLDPENAPQTDVDGLKALIDELTLSEAAKALIEPVYLDGEIHATLVKLFSEPIALDGVINARVNYVSGATGAAVQTADASPAGGGRAGGSRGSGNQETSNDPLNIRAQPDDPSRYPWHSAQEGQRDRWEQTQNPAPGRGLGGAGAAGGGRAGQPSMNAVMVSLPASLRDAMTGQASTLLQIEAGQKEFFQNSNQFYSDVTSGLKGLGTMTEQLSGIRGALEMTSATETTLLSVDTRLAGIESNTKALTELPLVMELAQPGAVGLDAVPVGLQNESLDLIGTIQNLKSLRMPPDLAQMPGVEHSESSPMYVHQTNVHAPTVQDVRIVGGTVDVKQMGTVDVRQVDTVEVKQTGTVDVRQSGTVDVRGVVGVAGTVDVNVVNDLSAALDVSLDDLHVALRDAGVRVDAVGA